MPRTKVPRKNAAKRNRNSVTEEGQAENIRQLEDRFESWKVEEALIHDQCLEKFDTMIKSIITKIPDHILHMTMGELAENPKQFDKSTGRVPLNRTNQGNSTASSSQRSRDTGYSTEDGAHSTASRSARPIGPLGSSRAGKNRRSQSAQGSTTKNKSLMRSNSAVTAHASRQKFRTPAQSRLQTMSADRGTMNPVTPKMQKDTPVAFLRYAHVGETVMSMSGSPVIVQGNCHGGAANVNIPVLNGVLSLQPTAMSFLDYELTDRIHPDVIAQLMVLQNNINSIVQLNDNRN